MLIHFRANADIRSDGRERHFHASLVSAHTICARLRCQQTRRPAHFFMVTNVMPFTRLLASMKLPSRVTDVLRTMFPPPGIDQLWNFSILGSKRTTVFGVDRTHYTR